MATSSAVEKAKRSAVEAYIEKISDLLVATCTDCIDTVEFLVKR
jgi:hypothetical protein